MLKVGDPAPAFSGPSSQGKDVALADFAGRWLVLYFYPKAFTPGCTRETMRFRDNHAELESLGASVVGVSHDALGTQCSFADAMRVPFPLVSDGSRAIARAYGVARSLLPISKRVTYVIDPKGVVRAVFEHEFQVSKHLDDVVKFLKAQST